MKRRKPNKKKWADHYTFKAKKENYPARSVYKLMEIQKKTGILKKGFRILDLGCAPGSWLIHASQITGKKGYVVGIDLKPVSIHLPENTIVCTGDVLNPDDALLERIGTNFDVVMSDMAPKTTGNGSVDAARSHELCLAAARFADRVLVAGGGFIAKIFQGEDFQSFSEQIRKGFQSRKIYKPQSSRKASRETYIIGLGKKREEICQDIINGLR